MLHSYAQVLSASDDGLSDDAIVGIALGAFGGLMLLIRVVYVVQTCRRHHAKSEIGDRDWPERAAATL